MSISKEDIDFAVELFSGLGGLSTRKMMGGLCIYHEGVIFAIIHSDGRIYLKAKGDLVHALESEGAERWTYQREADDKPRTMPYWTLPDEALEDPELACEWARRALAVL